VFFLVETSLLIILFNLNLLRTNFNWLKLNLSTTLVETNMNKRYIFRSSTRILQWNMTCHISLESYKENKSRMVKIAKILVWAKSNGQVKILTVLKVLEVLKISYLEGFILTLGHIFGQYLLYLKNWIEHDDYAKNRSQ